MEKEFETYWNKNQRRLIANAPKHLRDEYLDSTNLNTPVDWLCFIIPIAAGIFLQPEIRLQSEVLSWVVTVVVVVVLFAMMQLLKPLLQKKKNTLQVMDAIRDFYYERYKKYGLDRIENWQE